MTKNATSTKEVLLDQSLVGELYKKKSRMTTLIFVAVLLTSAVTTALMFLISARDFFMPSVSSLLV